MKKNPWPIALIVFIGGAFAFTVWVAVTMIRQKVDLVVPDYYEQDLKHTQRMEQERRAKALAVPLRVSLDGDAVRLVFPDPAAVGSIGLYRASDSRLDRSVDIAPGAGGEQRIPVAGLAAGPWKIQVAWQQGGAEYYQTETIVVP
jgi:nitrogen fixation protein FixH